MNIKQSIYKIKGMRKDDSYSSFNPEYSWDNKNIRLTARDSNDLLSVTNEKGNSQLSFNDITPERIFTYSYASTFVDHINEIIDVSYTYQSTFGRYVYELSDGPAAPSYTYDSEFTSYINELIEI